MDSRCLSSALELGRYNLLCIRRKISKSGFNCISLLFAGQSKGDDVKKAVEWALEAGYRHIDTAFIYLNEAAVGDVLHEWISSGKIKREELFIVTKVNYCFY